MTARFSIPLVLAFVAAGPAAAQTINLSPSDPKRWDATVSIGWLGGNKEGIGDRWNEWYDTFATSVDAGRYWTPHFKTELGAGHATRASWRIGGGIDF